MSATFPAPAYQSAAGITGATDSAGSAHAGRGVPDIAGMVGTPGFFANGIAYNFVGTSCVAPLYAGLAAVLSSAIGLALGPLNHDPLHLRNVAFNDITAGNNDSNDTPANVASVIPGLHRHHAQRALLQLPGPAGTPAPGLGSIDGTKLLNGIASALYNPNFYFQVNKGSFGLDEVKLNADLRQPHPDLAGPGGLHPERGDRRGHHADRHILAAGRHRHGRRGQPEIATALTRRSASTFRARSRSRPRRSRPSPTAESSRRPGTRPRRPRSCCWPRRFTIDGQLLPAAETTLTLEPGADPYFANFATNGEFYLSQDLRVFTVTPGINKAPIDGIALNAPDNTNWDTGAATPTSRPCSTISTAPTPTRRRPTPSRCSPTRPTR